MEVFDDSLKELLEAHLALVRSGLKYDLDSTRNGVASFQNPSAIKLKLAMQGDDGTAADAVDVIQKFASKCEGVELKDE